MSINKDFTKKSSDAIVYKRKRIARKLTSDEDLITTILKRMVKTYEKEEARFRGEPIEDYKVHCRNVLRAAIKCTTIDGSKSWETLQV